MNPSDIRIGFVPIARPTFDLDLARDLTAQVYAAINETYHVSGSQDLVMDGEAVAARIADLSAADVDMVLLLQSTFADSTMALQVAQALEAPLLLWALPEAQVGGRLRINSFCGINLAGHGLRRAGVTYDYIYAAPDDPAALSKLGDFAVAARVKRLLASARIGRLGEHPAGFDTCRVNHAALKVPAGRRCGAGRVGAFLRARRSGGPDQGGERCCRA